MDDAGLRDAGKGKSLSAYWKFEGDDLGRDASETGNHLTAVSTSPIRLSPELAAVVDFCHVLLNSNEFLYLD